MGAVLFPVRHRFVKSGNQLLADRLLESAFATRSGERRPIYGGHRRVMRADLMAYIVRRDAARQAALDDLGQFGQEFDAS